MSTWRSTVAFSIAGGNAALMLAGMAVGFWWKWEPNIGLELMALFMVLAFLTAGLQLFILRPRLALPEQQKAVWTALALLPLGGVALFLALAGGLYVLVSLFLNYTKRHGV